MSRYSSSENPFLEIGFRSASSEGTLQTIELIGVPGERLPNGEYAVSDKVRKFFDDLIVRSLFRKSRFIPECDFRTLKIWLYDTEISNQERGYEIPKIDQRDLRLRENNMVSKLESIYILDNELEGKEYGLWKKICKELFGTLFANFIAPPEPPSIIADNPLFQPLVQMMDNLTGAVDHYGQMKKKLFFNALIIQVD
jgi:hypothetical protein